MKAVFHGLSMTGGGHKHTLSRDNVMKQVVVAGGRSEGMMRRAFFPSKLEQGAVNEILVRKQGKGVVGQENTSIRFGSVSF